MRLISIALLIFTSCVGVRLDRSMPAVMANDLTALVDGSDLKGCGTQLQVGLLFCRVAEGYKVTEKIYFIAPPVKCEREACVFIKVYSPNGEPAIEKSVPKGSTEVGILWSELLHDDHFKKDQRGFWGFKRKMYFIGDDGKEHFNEDEGLIYLRVLDSGYESLHESRDNDSFAWTFLTRGKIIKVTTSGRTYVGSGY